MKKIKKTSTLTQLPDEPAPVPFAGKSLSEVKQALRDAVDTQNGKSPFRTGNLPAFGELPLEPSAVPNIPEGALDVKSLLLGNR